MQQSSIENAVGGMTLSTPEACRIDHSSYENLNRVTETYEKIEGRPTISYV